jgi:hypothetical protein
MLRWWCHLTLITPYLCIFHEAIYIENLTEHCTAKRQNYRRVSAGSSFSAGSAPALAELFEAPFFFWVRFRKSSMTVQALSN